MNEDNKNQTDQVIEEQQPSDETNSEHREISEDKLKHILENHKRWLRSKGKEGERANLKETNLREVDLKKADLSNADLQRSNLFGADMEQANLELV